MSQAGSIPLTAMYDFLYARGYRGGSGYQEMIEFMDESLLKCRLLNSSPTTKKPPLGLPSLESHNRQRLLDLLAAISRYVADGIDLPPEWLQELDIHLTNLKEGK